MFRKSELSSIDIVKVIHTCESFRLSLNLLHPYIHLLLHVHEKCLKVLWREEGLEEDFNYGGSTI